MGPNAPQGRRLRRGLPRGLRDVLAGLIFVALGLGFAGGATGYEIGDPVRMGPGYFPLVLGGILAALGAVIAGKGLLAADGEAIGTIPWRAIVLIVAAVIFFGLTVRGLGLIPATFITILLSAVASRRATPIGVALLSVGMTVVCVLVFVVALSVRLPLIGPWIPL